MVTGTVVSGAVVTGTVVSGAVVTGTVVSGAVVTGAVVSKEGPSYSSLGKVREYPNIEITKTHVMRSVLSFLLLFLSILAHML